MKKKEHASLGQRKLTSMGISLPLFPMTLVGSLPKHDDLKELRYRVSKHVLPASDLERKERLSIDLWIREQERLGMTVFVDGGMVRSDMIGFFADRIDGFVPGGFVRCSGNTYYRKPILRKKCAWKGPIVAEMWQSTQRLTHKPLKAILTGPYTLADWSFLEYYPSREAALGDLTAILRQEIAELIQRGAKIIQIDEPAISSRPHEFSLISDAIRELTRGFNAYFCLHHFYGDLSPIWKKMQSLPVDNLSISIGNPVLTLAPLLKKIPTTKDVTVDMVMAETEIPENARTWGDRSRLITRLIPKEQIWLSMDTGLQNLPPDVAIQKMKNLSEATQKIREQNK